MNKIFKVKRTLLLLIAFCLINVIGVNNVKAECYKTLEGNSYKVNYNSDNTKVTSISINFSYIDNVDLIAQNDLDRRQYNIIFTRNASKKTTSPTGYQDVHIRQLSRALRISDAIYSDNAMVSQTGVNYTKKTYAECDALAGTTVLRSDISQYCTLVTGTYNITDRSVLGKFSPETTYYGLLASGFLEKGAWYTSVAIDVEINKNAAFVLLNESTKPVITISNNHNPAENGDILTANSNADEVIYEWYYDDDNDGIPDEGTLLGSGPQYTIKAPDTSNSTHDDTLHKIICVASQNQDENGNILSGNAILKQSSLPIIVKAKEKGNVEVVEPTTPNANNAKPVETADELIAKINFTDDELNAINNGKDIEIYLEVKDISDSVSASDKEKIESKLGTDDKIGMYLDVNLFKKIDGQEATKITETKEEVEIEFEIPENLINKDSKVSRTYAVLRLHNGEVTTIKVELNGTKGKFKTKEFSTYALTYTDTAITNNPQTGDNIMFYISILGLSIIGLTGAGIYFKKKKFN